MDLSLNDPDNGSYGAGKLKLGKEGDFVTSPTISNDFAELLVIQLIDWVNELIRENDPNSTITIVDIGPGEGTLTHDLIVSFTKYSPELLDKIEFILVERNYQMLLRQKNLLKNFNLPKVEWKSIDELVSSPVVGIIIANEFFDALPVERILLNDGKLFRQGVKACSKTNQILEYSKLPLSKNIISILRELRNYLGIEIPPAYSSEGWTTELHVNVEPYLSKLSKSLKSGKILVIDYFIEESRYYNHNRNCGTLLAYKGQKASQELLNEPGSYDITAHLCLETFIFYAGKSGLNFVGQLRQGEALLALGLSERLSNLMDSSNSNIKASLQRREALLRLVDPLSLGDFRWLIFDKNNSDDDIKVPKEYKILHSRLNI